MDWATIIAGGASAGSSMSTALANINQAAINRQFARDMASTSYQNAVKDLKAAGLNPALAYGQGGAWAGSAGGQGGIDFGDPANAINSARSVEVSKEQTDINKRLADVEVEKRAAETNSAKAIAENQAAQAAEARSRTELNEQTALRVGYQMQLDEANRNLANASAAATRAGMKPAEAKGKLWDIGGKAIDFVTPEPGWQDRLKNWFGEKNSTEHGPGKLLKDLGDAIKKGKRSVSDVFSHGEGNVYGGASSAKQVERAGEYNSEWRKER